MISWYKNVEIKVQDRRGKEIGFITRVTINENSSTVYILWAHF